MSLNTALGNALSGLGANARRAEVVSANLANALTEGYGRRALDVSSRDLGGQGGGVQVDGTSRLVDRAVLADRRGAEARMTGRDAMAEGLRALEATFGAADGGTDLSARLRALDGAYVLRDLGNDSTEVTYRLALDVSIPLIGMLKRKGEKILIDTALKGLKKRVESTVP